MRYLVSRPGTALVAVLAAAAVLGAGCGSSSSSKSPPGATTPAASTPATPSTSSTPTSVNPNKVPPSTPIASSAYRNALIDAGRSAGLSSSGATYFADCVVKAVEATGAKTQGDLTKLGGNAQIKLKLGQDLSTCAQQAKSR